MPSAGYEAAGHIIKYLIKYLKFDFEMQEILHMKSYNQTTTKRYDIYTLYDIYHLLTNEISDIYVKMKI